MYVCEDCKDKVGANGKESTPSRKADCERCGKHTWCFRVVKITDELVFSFPCSHIDAIKQDLVIEHPTERDEPTTLRYHELVFNTKGFAPVCPTCGDSINVKNKVLEDWIFD